MEMNLMELFANSDNEEIVLIIRSLIDRIPILIIGESDYDLEPIMNELAALIVFRNKMIYYTDFINEEDYQNIIENEDFDAGIQRNIFLSYPFSTNKALETISNFKSWIFGVCNKKDPEDLQSVISQLINKTDYFTKIYIIQDKLKTELEGRSFPLLDLSFEKWLYRYAIKSTEISIEKMRRVISKRIKIKKIGKEKFDNLMNFSIEEMNLKENIISKEISNFFDACRRSYNILIRFENLSNLGFSFQLSTKTLLSTVAYGNSPIDRILSFISIEWGQNFNNFLVSKRVSNFTDTFESLWG